jgi:hypothetical protein
LADNIFDSSILTDVQEALESLYDIGYLKYTETPEIGFEDSLTLKGNFISQSSEEFKKFNISQPVAGVFIFAYNTLKDKGVEISKSDRLTFYGNEYVIREIEPTAFVVIDGENIPAIFNIQVTSLSVKPK